MGHDILARTPESHLACMLIAFRAASRSVVAHADRTMQTLEAISVYQRVRQAYLATAIPLNAS